MSIEIGKTGRIVSFHCSNYVDCLIEVQNDSEMSSGYFVVIRHETDTSNFGDYHFANFDQVQRFFQETHLTVDWLASGRAEYGKEASHD